MKWDDWATLCQQYAADGYAIREITLAGGDARELILTGGGVRTPNAPGSFQDQTEIWNPASGTVIPLRWGDTTELVLDHVKLMGWPTPGESASDLPQEPRRYEYPFGSLTSLDVLTHAYECSACGRRVDAGDQHTCEQANVPMDVAFRCEVCHDTFTMDDVFDEPAAVCSCVWEAAAGEERRAPRWRVYWPADTLGTDDVKRLLIETAGLGKAAEWLEAET